MDQEADAPSSTPGNYGRENPYITTAGCGLSVSLPTSTCPKKGETQVIHLAAISCRAAAQRAVSFEESRHAFQPAGGVWETRLEVDAVLAQLSEELRVTLLLREVAGQSYAEIAEELGVPIGTVRSRLSAAREQFRRKWNEAETEEEE